MSAQPCSCSRLEFPNAWDPDFESRRPLNRSTENEPHLHLEDGIEAEENLIQRLMNDPEELGSVIPIDKVVDFCQPASQIGGAMGKNVVLVYSHRDTGEAFSEQIYSGPLSVSQFDLKLSKEV